MSSYFDRAVQMVSEALQHGDPALGWEIASVAVNRYSNYLYLINSRAESKDRQETTRLYAKSQQILREMSLLNSPLETVEKLHELAHELGNLKLSIPPRFPCVLDNPYQDDLHDPIQDSIK